MSGKRTIPAPSVMTEEELLNRWVLHSSLECDWRDLNEQRAMLNLILANQYDAELVRRKEKS